MDKQTAVEKEVKKGEASNSPQIMFSIVVLENGAVIVSENGELVRNVQKVEFVADGGSEPRYTITKAIAPKKVV